MNIALFGGTFDPVHRGHLAVAKAAQRRFKLRQILFVPAYVSPLKQRQPITPLLHRYAMLTLATEHEKAFVPSLLEVPAMLGGTAPDQAGPSYTMETVNRLKRRLGRRDRLFFVIGIDAFLDIAKWYKAAALLQAVEFIVASRPGFCLTDVHGAIERAAAKGDIGQGRASIHLLDGVHETVSATEVRAAASRGGRELNRLVGPAVADYIRKLHLYGTNSSGSH